MSDPTDSQQTHAYTRIKLGLLTGAYAPDQRLSRRGLAAELGISAPTVQHVLGQLAKEGLVEVRPQSGSYPRLLSETEVMQLDAVRLQLEPYAAEEAATRATAAHLAALAESVALYAHIAETAAASIAAGEFGRVLAEVYAAERQFHGTLWTASGNPFLANMLERMQILACVAMTAHRRSEHFAETTVHTVREHRDIYEAVAQGDGAAAARLMRIHLTKKTGRDRR